MRDRSSRGAFALWAVLAVVRPAWRPRLDILTVLLALTLVAGLVSAFSGISVQRSLWSGYPRMGGLVDAAHWLAFAVLLSAMLRTAAHWRCFLNLNLAVGLAAALVGAARFHFPEATGVVWWPEPHDSRASATFANPLFFAAHMQAVALLAAGFLVQSFLGAPAPAALRALWALTAVAAAWALALSGSMGAMAGLGAGAGAAALFHAVLGPSRRHGWSGAQLSARSCSSPSRWRLRCWRIGPATGKRARQGRRSKADSPCPCSSG